MRDLINLLPVERKILKELVEFKRNSNAGIQNFQSGRILEQSARFNFAAIKWDKDGNKPIQIYYEDKKDEQDFYSNLFILYDYLLFLEELEKERLIVVLSAKLEEEREEERILFNRRKFDNKEVFNSWQLNNSENGFIYWDNSRKEYKSWIDIVSYLEKYVYLKIIHPTSVLESFVNNGFNTVEQIRHDAEMNNLEQQLNKTRKATGLAWTTLIVTLVLGAIELFCNTKIKTHELESIDNSYQYMNSPQLPDNTVIVSDTITSVETFSTDNCNITNPVTLIPSKQSERTTADFQKDTSIITTDKTRAKNAVVIRTNDQ